MYWKIRADEDYIEQIGKLPITTQENIRKQWHEVAKHENPRDVGFTDDCGTPEEDCPYITVRFMGLVYEFIYKMDKAVRTLTLIDCVRLSFLDHGQTE